MDPDTKHRLQLISTIGPKLMAKDSSKESADLLTKLLNPHLAYLYRATTNPDEFATFLQQLYVLELFEVQKCTHPMMTQYEKNKALYEITFTKNRGKELAFALSGSGNRHILEYLLKNVEEFQTPEQPQSKKKTQATTKGQETVENEPKKLNFQAIRAYIRWKKYRRLRIALEPVENNTVGAAIAGDPDPGQAMGTPSVQKVSTATIQNQELISEPPIKCDICQLDLNQSGSCFQCTSLHCETNLCIICYETRSHEHEHTNFQKIPVEKLCGEPLQILNFSEDNSEGGGNKVEFYEENFKSVLAKVGPLPFILFSMNGPTRTGKSYALNYFLRYLTAQSQSDSNSNEVGVEIVPDWLRMELKNKFIWRSGMDRTTVGISIWSKPFIVEEDSQNGGEKRKVAILLMDCQGLFDKETTPRQNAIIFTISALCSSVFIFNVMRTIDDSHLQQLQFFTSYVKMVARLTANDDDEDSDQSESKKDAAKVASSELGMQKLIFLIRDFDFPGYNYGYHDDEGCGGTGGGGKKNIFKDIFLPDGTATTAAPQNKLTRDKILSAFQKIGVFLLPDPGKSFRRDPAATLPDEDFLENLKNFVEMLLHTKNNFRSLTRKIANGDEEMSGTQFQKNIKRWAPIFAKAEELFPALQTSEESTATIQNTTAMDNAFSFYNEQMTKLLSDNPGLSDQEFDLKHQEIEAKAYTIFDNMPRASSSDSGPGPDVEIDDLVKKFRERLHLEIAARFESHKKINSILRESLRLQDKSEIEIKRREDEIQKIKDELKALDESGESGQESKVKKSLESKLKGAIKDLDKIKEEQEKQRQIFEKKMAKEKSRQETQETGIFTSLLHLPTKSLGMVGRGLTRSVKAFTGLLKSGSSSGSASASAGKNGSEGSQQVENLEEESNTKKSKEKGKKAKSIKKEDGAGEDKVKKVKSKKIETPGGKSKDKIKPEKSSKKDKKESKKGTKMADPDDDENDEDEDSEAEGESSQDEEDGESSEN